MTPLHSHRLTLRPLTEQDADIVLELFTNPNVLKFADNVMQRNDVLNSMSKWVRRGGDGYIGVWCVLKRHSDEKLGTVALLPLPVDESETNFELVVPGLQPKADIEIGFYFKPTAWGNGYATEACTMLLENVFKTSSLSEIVATFHPDNSSSRNVLTKLGFIDCGTMRCYGDTGPNYRLSRLAFTQED